MSRKRRPPAERVIEPEFVVPLTFRLEGVEGKWAKYTSEFEQDIKGRTSDLIRRANEIIDDPSSGKELQAIAAMILGQVHSLECADGELENIHHAFNLGILAERLRFFDEWIAQNWLTVSKATRQLNDEYEIPVSKAAISKAGSEGRLRTNGATGHARRIDPQSLVDYASSRCADDLE